MAYLLDTCVLSEFKKKQPEQKVIDWLDAQVEETLFLSVVTSAKFRKVFPACLLQNEKPSLKSGWQS